MVSIVFICDPLTTNYISLIYDTIFNLLSDTLFEILNGVCTKLKPSDRAVAFGKSLFEVLKHLASKLNDAALQSRKESVHKIAGQEIEGLNFFIKPYKSSARNAD